MEKMRRIFPVLLVLVFVLGIMIVPVQEAQAEFPKPTDGICPCCGHVGLKTPAFSSPDGYPMDKYVCPSCCYYSLWDGRYFFEETYCVFSSEWSVDEQKGTHYHKCTGYHCSQRADEDSHSFSGAWTPDVESNTHQNVCTVCNATVAEAHTVSVWTPVEGTDTHKGTCSVCGEAIGKHIYSNWVRIEGTEKHKGTCKDCGAEIIVDCSGGTATCVAKAVCEFCGQEYGETDANNHNPDINNWTIDPDLGIHYHKCLNDGCTKQFALAKHNFESWTPVEGSNTHQGTCTECGATVTKPHSGSGWTPVEGTDTHQGTCKDCGATITEPHSVSGWTPVDETNTHQGTCTKCGVKVTGEHNFSFSAHNAEGEWHLCSFCWAVDGAPSEHHWGDWCNALDGTHYRRCTTCDELSVPVPHQYEPTYVDEEYHMWICACGAEQPETEAEPHNYVLTDVGEGYHMWKCACGAVKPETEAQEHEYGNWARIEGTNTHKGVCDCGAEEITNCSGGTPTCTAGAICDICGLEYGEPDPANHDLVHHDAKAATCTEIGWEAYDTCKREGCGYTTYKEIAALGHDIEHHDAKAATCTEDGWPAYDTCKREGCNYTTLLMMQARLGHDLTHHEGKAATCTEAGWEAYDTCKREGCDYTTYKEIPALGHDLVKHDAKAATCTEAGWDAYDTCSRCSYTTCKEIHALGHTPGQPETVSRVEPQVGKAGYLETVIHCTVCGLELERSSGDLPPLPEPVPDTKEETTGKPDAEIAIAPKKTVLRIIQPEFLEEEEQELELSVIRQIVSDDSGVHFQTDPHSFFLNIPSCALKLIEAKVWRLERFYDLTDRVILDYTGSQEFPLNLDLIMILVYRDDAGEEHWEVLKKPTRLFGNRLRAEVDAALVRKLEHRPFAIIILADDGTR